MTQEDGYAWGHRQDVAIASHAYLAPATEAWLRDLDPKSVIDLGCGDGRLTQRLHGQGYAIEGLDSSSSAVAEATKRHPNLTFTHHDLLEPLPDTMVGRYDVVIAVEVIEHLLLPRNLFYRAREALSENGRLIITTPYHGYIKNLALAVSGRLENHFTVGWDYGHIKFFSQKTLAAMATESGFTLERFARLGRIAPIAASMAAQFRLT